MRVFSATIITAMVLLPLTGCAKKENQAPTAVKTPAPSSKKTTKAPPKAPVSVPPAKPEAGVPAAPSQSQASNPTVTAVPLQPAAYFGEVLAAWIGGRKDEAVKQFLQMRWQDPSVFEGIPMLVMSEQQFAALPQAQRDPIGRQAQQFSTTIGDIATAVIASGEKASASGDAAGAKARFEAVQQFGQTLAAPERLLIIQQVGKAVAKVAQEKLPASQ